MTKPSKLAAGELTDAIEGGLSPADYEVDDLMGATDCPHGCQIEADATCPHGYESAGITAGVI